MSLERALRTAAAAQGTRIALQLSASTQYAVAAFPVFLGSLLAKKAPCQTTVGFAKYQAANRQLKTVSFSSHELPYLAVTCDFWLTGSLIQACSRYGVRDKMQQCILFLDSGSSTQITLLCICLPDNTIDKGLKRSSCCIHAEAKHCTVSQAMTFP